MEFKKGEMVFVHARDTRDGDELMVVTSVGKKWITCNSMREDGTPFEGGGIRFNANTLCEKDFNRHQLYHTKEEFEESSKRDKMCLELRRELQYDVYSLEELLLFKEIHETGIEKWKELHYKE